MSLSTRSMPRRPPTCSIWCGAGTASDARCLRRCTTSTSCGRTFRRRCSWRANRSPGAAPRACSRRKTCSRRAACARPSTSRPAPAPTRKPRPCGRAVKLRAPASIIRDGKYSRTQSRRTRDRMRTNDERRTQVSTLYEIFIGPFSEFEFMQRALAGVLALALGACPIGVFLMLRRMSLVGDAMAHAILPGAAVGFLLSGLNLFAMTAGGLIAGFVVALLTGLVARTTELKEDAALATFYLLSLAVGVTIISLKGTNIDLLHVLFGNVLALDDQTLLLIAANATITLIVLAVIYRPLVIECVDPGFMRTVSSAGGPAHLAFLVLVVVNLVSGFHALGTLLAVGIMMLPAAIGRFWARDTTLMLVIATVSGAASGYAGLLISFHTGVASGPAIILVAGGLYLASLLFGRVGGLVRQAFPGRHLEA